MERPRHQDFYDERNDAINGKAFVAAWNAYADLADQEHARAERLTGKRTEKLERIAYLAKLFCTKSSLTFLNSNAYRDLSAEVDALAALSDNAELKVKRDGESE